MTKFILILAFLLSLNVSRAQVFTGGNVSISYENGIYADIAPVLGYQLNDMRAGISPILSYRRASTAAGALSYGARIFGQYTVIEGAFLHAEFQALNTEANNELKNRVWTMSLPVGAGYEFKISEKARAQASILYDLIQDPNSPNRNPIIRGGVFYDL